MVSRKFKSELPPLVFCGRSAHVNHSMEVLSKQLKTAIPSIQDCASLLSDGAVSSTCASVMFKGLKLTSLSCTPLRTVGQAKSDCILMIPFTGKGSVKLGSQALQWKAGAMGVWLPKVSFIDEGTTRSTLLINIDPNRVARVARIMLGLPPEEPLTQELLLPREVALQVGRVSFETIFRQFSSMVDQFVLQPELLELSGIDDNFYRNASMMLHPGLFLEAEETKVGAEYARRRLDRICQYIQANLGQPITLTDLEQVGFMSRRNLHYAFQNRYGCTPMQWVRQERLILAHSLLVMARVGTTVTDVALECGFSKSTTFSAYYLKQFGEAPSLTLSRALSR